MYRAYGLPEECRPVDLPVQVVSTGLADVLLPVDSGETLAAAIQDEAEVKRLSEELDVVGVHMFCRTPGTQAVALCRNFAPRYAIPEEAATGTSNGALTYYLYRLGLVEAGADGIVTGVLTPEGRGGEPLFPGGVHGETLGDPDPAAGDPVGPQGTGGRAGGAVPAV